MQQIQSSFSNTPLVQTHEGELREAISLALRAPSSHNSQPWRLRLRNSQLELQADTARRLEVVDPEGRELLISCGAALFSLRVALEHAGYDCNLELYPDAAGDDPLLARMQLQRGARTLAGVHTAMFDALTQRQTQRAAFSAEPLPDGTAACLIHAAEREGGWLQIFSGYAARSLAALVAEGDILQWKNPRFRQELAAWMRPNTGQRRDGLAGHTVGLGNLLSHLAPWVIRHFDTGASQARKDEKLMLNAPLVVVLATDGDTRADWLTAGQALQHVLLKAATLGVSAGFMNQPLQCAALRRRVNALLERPGHGQLIIRFGCAKPGRPSLRRHLTDVLSE